MSETFSVTATDGAGRAGILRTAHGDVCGLSNPVWVFPSRFEGKIAGPHGRNAG